MTHFSRFFAQGPVLAEGVHPPDIQVRIENEDGRPVAKASPAGHPGAEAQALRAWFAPRKEALRSISAYGAREGLPELAKLAEELFVQFENPSIHSVYGTLRLLQTLAAADPARAAQCEAEMFLTAKILEMMGEEVFAHAVP